MLLKNHQYNCNIINLFWVYIVVLCYVVLCYAVLCCVMLCYVVLCCVMLCCVALHYIPLHCISLRYIALCCVISYHITLHCMVSHCFVLYWWITLITYILQHVTFHFFSSKTMCALQITCAAFCYTTKSSYFPKYIWSYISHTKFEDVLLSLGSRWCSSRLVCNLATLLQCFHGQSNSYNVTDKYSIITKFIRILLYYGTPTSMVDFV